MVEAQHNVRVRDFRLQKLTLVDVGPFREYYEIDFTDTARSDDDVAASDIGPEPANFFMLLSKNGFGKTTALEVIALLLELVGADDASHFGHYDLDEGNGKVQADFRGTWSIDDARSSVLLSVWAGSEGPISAWTLTDLEAIANASEWATISLVRSASTGRIELGSGTNELGHMLVAAVRQAYGTPPPALFGEGCNLPTILFSPADRALTRPPIHERSVSVPEHWGYRPAYRFAVDGSKWSNSLDNLLVWLSWLADDRDKALRDYVRQFVFMDGRKTPT